LHFESLKKRINNYISTESNILKPHQDFVKGLIKPALAIVCEERTADKSDSKKSKIGGKPLVNDEMSEFLKKNKDYVFVFQLNFADIENYAQELSMPSNGLVSVFIKATSQQNIRYLDPAHSKVFFSDDAKEIYKDYMPDLNILQSEFSFKELLTIPDHEDDIWEAMENDYDDFAFDCHEPLSDKIYEICKLPEYIATSYIGGYNSSVQYSVYYDFATIELIDEPVYSKAYFEKREERWEKILSKGHEYTQLCQIETLSMNSNLKDYLDGVLYIGLRKEELKNNDFSNLKFVVQNT